MLFRRYKLVMATMPVPERTDTLDQVLEDLSYGPRDQPTRSPALRPGVHTPAVDYDTSIRSSYQTEILQYRAPDDRHDPHPSPGSLLRLPQPSHGHPTA